MKNFPLLLMAFLIVYAFSSCKKENDFNTDSSIKLSFSDDTIMFDTVFTTIGSTTQYLLVYNKESSPVKISSIRLAKGASSYYRMNVDGLPGRSFTNVEIGPKDSLWIFIEITIDPTNQSTPFLVTDSILFETNGNLQNIDLVAFGQNAHFITPTTNLGSIQYSIIPCAGNSAVWDSLLPYVIYGYAVVDSGCKLIINEGTKIYFYNNSGLWVFKDGTLKVNGIFEHPVTFQGTRLEQSYRDIPGQWDRIWINEGNNLDSNVINYAIIKNGFIGLQPENLLTAYGGNPRTLSVTNTIIKNMSGFGLLARDYTVHGFNNVIANCGQYNVALTIGGNYDFVHCTFANYWSQGQRSTPAVYLNNYYSTQTADVPVDLSSANFTNCIIYGNIDNELELDFKSGGSSAHFFGNCLLKVDNSVTPTSDPAHFASVFLNESPGFTDYNENDYTIDDGSYVIDKGNASYTGNILLDLNNKLRIAGAAPDLGAYEKQ